MRDLQLGTNYALTTSTLGYSTTSMVNPGLRFVAYGRAANSFVIWDSQTAAAVFTNTTSGPVSAISVSPDGNRIVYSIPTGFYGLDRAAKNNTLINASNVVQRAGLVFSADSRFLVYSLTAAKTAGDTNNAADVYLYDFLTQGNQLISQSDLWAGAANGPSDSPTISADGRLIAYRSSASDLVSGATNGPPNVYVFDRQTSNTTLVSISAYGNFAGNNRSYAPAFSGDSRMLVFPSWAGDLAAQDFNQSADLFSLAIYPAIAPLPFVGQIVFAPLSSQTPTLTWPAVSGKNYQVQFKDNLNDPLWQILNGSVTMVSNTASATDLAPSSSQRFYRIMAY
jgi:Tol biopolymer transport system component